MDDLQKRLLWRETDAFLLRLTVWREASNQPPEAMAAVCHCILNRVAKPSWWGRTLNDVCTKREQFTSMNTATNDPNLRRWPKSGDASWEQVAEIVFQCQLGVIAHPLPGCDSYYDDSIAPPYWAVEHPERCRGKIGKFSFYDMDKDVEPVRMV